MGIICLEIIIIEFMLKSLKLVTGHYKKLQSNPDFNSPESFKQFAAISLLAAVFLLDVKRMIDIENFPSLYNVFIFTNFREK